MCVCVRVRACVGQCYSTCHLFVNCFFISIECYYLEVEHAYNYEVNGVYYIYDYDLDCEGRNIYRHIDRELYLYHIDGWWVVHHQYCTEEGVIYGLVRGHDSSWTPELIIEIWEEHVSGHWDVNLLFDVDCYCE